MPNTDSQRHEAAPALLTEEQLSKRIQTPRRSLQRWRSTGDGPVFVRTGPRCVRYRVADVEAWIAGRSFPHLAAELASHTGRPDQEAA